MARKTALSLCAIMLALCAGALFAGPQQETTTEAKVLNATMTATPESLDPAVVIGENDWKIAVNLYDFLVYPSQENASPQPAVAERWELAPDNVTWTFFLRDGITFHDGSELTAEDVKFSMDRMITIGEGHAHFFRDRVIETKATDANTVVFKLDKPFGPFLVTLYRLGIVNKDLIMANLSDTDSMYGEFKDFGKKYLLTQDAGSGPYKIKEFKIRESVDFEKYQDYWQNVPAAAPDRIMMTQLREAATTKMLMGNGDIDLAHGRQELTTLNALDAIDNVDVAYIPEMSLNFFMLNTKKPPLDDVHVRKAMAWATDYQGMLEIYPDCPRVYGPVPPQVFGASENFIKYERDLDKAMQELQKSKYYGELDKYPIDVSYIQGNGDTPKLCMLFAQNMQEIGFEVNIVEAPWVLFCNKEESIETSPHVTNLFCNASYPEAGSILEFKYSSWTVGNWNQNEWLQDAKFDSMITEALNTADPDDRMQKYAEIQKYLVEDVCPSIFTFVSVVKPTYRTDRFSWPAGDDNPHAIAEFNFNMMDFETR